MAVISNALFANVPSDVAQLRLDTLWLWWRRCPRRRS